MMKIEKTRYGLYKYDNWYITIMRDSKHPKLSRFSGYELDLI